MNVIDGSDVQPGSVATALRLARAIIKNPPAFTMGDCAVSPADFLVVEDDLVAGLPAHH